MLQPLIVEYAVIVVPDRSVLAFQDFGRSTRVGEVFKERDGFIHPLSWQSDTPRIVDPNQDDATMAESVDSSTNKPGRLNGEYTDLKPAARVDEVDELIELSDTSLELNELSDTEDGVGRITKGVGGVSIESPLRSPFIHLQPKFTNKDTKSANRSGSVPDIDRRLCVDIDRHISAKIDR
ncbi:hypothetical protein DY000_02014571 [Brassica cretica]|uniref:Uncharacterized protein n=1 Tax=Brassica cretica TaxID=69181 RepID=A0ABQ7D2H2_BRACR|nr:hypothetical protein DY000_02014571 [Brassica cretica]